MSSAALMGDAKQPNHWGSASRFKHPSMGIFVAKVLPGYYYLTADDELINTVLGSCVCACVRDPIAGIGGMNHYMLPGKMRDFDPATSDTKSSIANRYGQHAMDNLLDHLILQGCSASNFEVKLFGGAHVMDIASDVGTENIAFAVQYFQAKNIPVVSSDFGDDFPRKVNYSPRTGKVKMMKLRGAYTGLVASNENQVIASV